jgi:hypothetical protein
MKLRHTNVHNIRHLVPRWAIDPFTLAKHLEQQFALLRQQAPELWPRSPHERLKFWVEINCLASPRTVRIAIPDEEHDYCGRVLLTCSPLIGSACQVDLPLNSFLIGADPADSQHSVYVHSFQTDVPLSYFGITKKAWYERLNQHIRSARDGSPYLFHRAIREHQKVCVLHKVMLAAVNEDTALEMEEEWVGMFSLYPLGLNMIPGGRAGIRYLSKLSVGRFSNIEERDVLLERLSAQDDLPGKQNPLCAARWAADIDYVERVICGHSGRLSADQVRTIRTLASFGKRPTEIQTLVGTTSRRQIDDLLRGVTYTRIR